MTAPHRPTPAALAAHRALNHGTTSPYPELGVKELFEAQAARRPAATALVHPGGSLDYRTLDGLANDLAARLSAAGVRPGDTVTVRMARSAELIIALLATVKCGAAYLPADPAWPDDRLHALLERTGGTHVLTRADDAEDVLARLPGRHVLPVEQGSLTERQDSPAYRGSPDDIAYINFTSGSTGTPKGVPVRHRGIVRLVHDARYARLDEDTVLLQLAPASFDAATFEIWGALLHGGTCVLYPDSFIRLGRLRRVLTEHRVSVLFLTTALFNTVVDEAPDTLATVTTVLTGGEAHSLTHMATALRVYGTERIVSVYGPTECTTFATYHPVRQLHPDESSLPIGRPIQNTRAYVVQDGRLCEPGETGEILLAGPGLSPGYLGLPETNARQFVDLDLDGVRERLYRTGDRACLSERGHLVFQGRLDDQVKVNGFRIELGEIAYHLDAHVGVRQSFVTTRPNGQGGQELVAFVVPDAAGRAPEEFRAHLLVRLPAYMVPSVVRLCEALPLTATGKVDRRALLAGHGALPVSVGVSS
ncbi:MULTISPECIES: amino acid adenylation domain-containing protein [unclassified Kitasatospora]|uniref:amino acid adenylation domain-containing protein n=1 Tax=unclassified Kitasatospora TaxID=2633591 RepID=UPI00070ED49E|nr:MULTISPECIES: amino acid adenylation domain-containing protein [unclassified Kitasatospora]KQV19258.1 peptide synthetase [Kitasatospora sp. Root107]KRB77534.1 peptide synthetase [Kitasatospora sp. Root187]